MKRLLLLTLTSIFIVSLTIVALPATPAHADGCLDNPNAGGCRAGLPVLQYQSLLDEMLLHKEPDVRPLAPNESEISRFAFRRLSNPNGTEVFNAPNGVVVRTIAAGFNYVSAEGQQDGWIKINEGEWVRESDTAVTRPSNYSGVFVNPDSKYTMAWIVYPVKPAPAPGYAENPDAQRLEKYTRVNIFATVVVNGYNWYLIGPDAWVKQIYVGKVLFIDRPEGVKGRWFAVDLFEQVLVAYENDTPVFATLISSGLPEWSTNEGTFQSWTRLRNGPMSGAEGQTDFYSLENVPWTLYFDNSISIHGTYWHDGFGYRHSHGCVNMSITDSHWVYKWSEDGGYTLPFVHVWSSGEYRGE